MPVIPAHRPEQTRPIRGNISGAIFQVYQDGAMRYAEALNEDEYPFQKNNMHAWLEAILQKNQSRDLVVAYRRSAHTIGYQVNGYAVGHTKSIKKGRGSGDNTFSYTLGDTGWRIDLMINTEPYNNKYIAKIRAGEHVRQPKGYNTPQPLLYYTASGRCKATVERDGKWYYTEYPNADEFEAAHPNFQELWSRVRYVDDSLTHPQAQGD